MVYSQNRTVAAFFFFFLIGLLVIMPQVSRAQAVLEEIIVTAERRDQNLQDVPVSVTAISEDQIISLGIHDISRIEFLVPGLTYGRTGNNTHISIRGSRQEGILVNTEPTVAFYNDGIFRRGSQQGLRPLVDVQRVEVLRGPQGTLFGRNAYAGAINVISNKPSDELDFGVVGVIGEEERIEIQGFFNYAFNDVVSARIAGGRFRRDGFVKNSFRPDEALMDREEDFVRAQLLLKFNENVDLLIWGERWTQGGNGAGSFGYFSPGTIRDPGADGVANLDDPGSTWGTVVPFTTLSGARLSPADTDPYSIARDLDFINDTEQNTFAGQLDWTLGPVDIMVLVSYSDFENFHNEDADLTMFDGVVDAQFDENETWQEEIHIKSNTDGRFEWLVGAFFLQDEAGDEFTFDVLHPVPAANLGTFDMPNCSVTTFFLDDEPVITPVGGSLTSAAAAADNCKTLEENRTPGVFFFANRRDLETDSTAVFAQGTVKLADDRLRLTGGARWSEDDKKFQLICVFNSENGPDDLRDTTFVTPINFGLDDPAVGFTNTPFSFQNVILDTERSWDSVTWRAAVDFSFTPDNMTFASVSTGNSAGGFNSVANPITGLFTFEEQNVTAYEIGSKNTFRDGSLKLNVAVYYNDFEEMLAEPDEFVNSAVIIFNEVGGDGEAKGVDVELDWAATERWLLNAQFSYLDAEFGTFVTGSGSNNSVGTNNATRLGVDGSLQPAADVSGLEIPFSPEFTLGLNVQYSAPLGNYGTLIPRVTFYWSDEYWTSDQHYGRQAPNPVALQDSYTKTDLSLTWVSPDEHWSVQAFVLNVEDEAVITRTNTVSNANIGQFYSEPRHAGLRLTYDY